MMIDRLTKMHHYISCKAEEDVLVGIVWVGVGFRFENPHQAGLGFSGEERFGVGFTVGFWWVFTKPTLKKILILPIVLLERRGI